MLEDTEKTQKIALLGLAAAGKTSIVKTILSEFNLLLTLVPTKGVERSSFKFLGRDILIWDFGGQQVFRHILKTYATGANGALLLFDLTNKSSLGQIYDWVDIFRENDSNLPIIFLGTKLDLTDLIVVEDKDAIFFKEKYDFLDYIKVSSKTDENINLAFQLLVNEIMKNL